jgi:hypothetical protein
MISGSRYYGVCLLDCPGTIYLLTTTGSSLPDGFPLFSEPYAAKLDRNSSFVNENMVSFPEMTLLDSSVFIISEIVLTETADSAKKRIIEF